MHSEGADGLADDASYRKYEPSHENLLFACAKTKAQISCAIIVKLISAFVFATWIVQSLYFLNPKFQACSHLLNGCTDQFVSDQVGNHKDGFCHGVAHMVMYIQSC